MLIAEAASELAEEPDPTLQALGRMLAELGGLTYAGGSAEDAARVDRIAILEQIKHAAAAAQAGEIVRFARSQVAAQRTAGVNYRRLGQGIAEQVGLACRVSGWHGARRLTLARDLVQELPHTLAAMAAGQLSEHAAQLIGTETSHLDPDTRRQVDQQLAAAGVESMSAKQTAAQARRLAYAADPAASLARAVKARKDRRVGCRPAPDTMAWLSALLPVEQAVACLAALRQAGDTAKAARRSANPRPGRSRPAGGTPHRANRRRPGASGSAADGPAGQPAQPRPHRARDHPRPRTPYPPG